MPKIRDWEKQSDNLDTFVPMVPRRTHQQRRKTEARDLAQKTEKIKAVSRYLEIGDARRINRIGKAAVAASDQKPTRPKSPEKYGISLLPPVMARAIYARHFHDPANPSRGLARFNEIVDEFIANDRDHATLTEVYLGDIVPTTTVYPHVMAMVRESKPMSVKDMRQQQFRLLYSLTGDEAYSHNQAYKPSVPHVSFERFSDFPSAQTFRNTLAAQDASLFTEPVLVKPPKDYEVAV